MTATDSDGLTDVDQMNFTVNGIPSAPVVDITPTTPVTGDALSVTFATPSIDPEGVIPTYTYQWQLGGLTQSMYTSSSLPASATSKGEQWTVIVTPNDGIVDGTSASASVVIGNTPPTVSTVSIAPSTSVYNDTVLTCSATATDPDETPTLNHQWTIGGTILGNSATIDLATTAGMPLDTVVCTVTAVDGDGASSSGSASVLLDNRNPTVMAVISTNGNNQNAELTCNTSASDPDGETPLVNIEWFNGSTSLGSNNPLQLNGTMVGSGDIIECGNCDRCLWRLCHDDSHSKYFQYGTRHFQRHGVAQSHCRGCG